jgi:hypothetical protein
MGESPRLAHVSESSWEDWAGSRSTRRGSRRRKTLDAGLPAPDNRITVGAYLERWLSTTLPGHIADSALDEGAPGGIRTPNLLIRSQMLYPLSYGRRFDDRRRV